jgi:diguanylate cyclase (GGDEF)-like protein
MVRRREFGYPHTPRTVARVGGRMMLAGGVITFFLCTVEPQHARGHLATVLAMATIATAIGLLCLAVPDRMPRLVLYLLPLLGILMICVSTAVTGSPADGTELLLIWPVLYASYFLPTRVAWANVVAAVGLYGPVTLHHMKGNGITPCVYLAGTSVCTMLIVSALRRHIAELVAVSRDEARTDGLTGLPNRRAWDEALAREVARRDRQGGSLALLLVDLDHFKRLNDTAGHAAGDQALRRLAVLLRGQLRQMDVLARIGGEEFVLLLPACRAAEAAERAEQLRSLVRLTASTWPEPVTVSVGVAAIPEHATHAAELVAAADLALYAAKNAGRDRVRTAPVPLIPACAPDPSSDRRPDVPEDVLGDVLEDVPEDPAVDAGSHTAA